MTSCLQCSNAVSRGAVMARNGFTGCKQLADWDFRATAAERDCPAFVRAPDEVLQTRIAWVGKK